MGPVKHINRKTVIFFILISGILLMLWQAFTDRNGSQDTAGESMISKALQLRSDAGVRQLLPVLAICLEEQPKAGLQETVFRIWMPGYLYQTRSGQVAVRQTGEETAESVWVAELTIEQLMQQENVERMEAEEEAEKEAEESGVVVLDLESLLAENEIRHQSGETQTESVVSTGENAVLQEDIRQDSPFVAHTRQQTVDLTALQDYETLREQFYAVDSITNIGSDLLDAEKLAGQDLTISKEAEGPQILIYHTHSQEGFADSVPGDESTTIMGVGEHLAEILEQQYGYQVLHHTGTYDVEERDSAYSRSLPAITQLLEEYPQIQVIIDLHRDAVADESNHLVMELDGRPTARFMFFNGISWTKKTGSISYLQNDNLFANLAFSFQMKLKAEEYYPGLTRKNYINGYRYNMHLRPRTLLIELGAQNNTLEEAMNACDPIAHLLDLVLSGEE